MAKKWSEKVTQRSFIKGHSFPIGLYYEIACITRYAGLELAWVPRVPAN